MPAADSNSAERIRVIDSHTAGEPTRVVIEGGPELGGGSLYERRELFREQFDRYRSAIVNEPRGADVLVGALLCEPVNPKCAAGVIFFNNVGYLNMCGHGAIGLVATLAWLGRIEPGKHLIETPIGEIATRLRDDGRVSVRNVPCYRWKAGVEVDVPDYGKVVGDVAWGGNWFFLVSEHREDLDHRNVDRLTEVALWIRAALRAQGITGNTKAEIDHIELFGPPQGEGADSRNFVLCPGGAYDRSPCGTGTSAKLACLAADGKLQPGQKWVQESIIGSRFEASYTGRPDAILPKITGAAYITAETTLILQHDDPLRTGIRG